MGCHETNFSGPRGGVKRTALRHSDDATDAILATVRGFRSTEHRENPDCAARGTCCTLRELQKLKGGREAVDMDTTAVRGITAGILAGGAVWGGLLFVVWLAWRLLVRFA